VLREIAQSLAPVAVTAREDALRRRNHLDADDIANAHRPILDGLDVVTRLRPDMIDPAESTPMDPCGLFYLWVNGRRVPLPADSTPLDDAMIGSRLRTLTPKPGPWVAYALAQIKPEHIEEITYKGCYDRSMDGAAQRNAAFIVLKSGIGYDWTRGSYVIDDDKTAAGRIQRIERQRADSIGHAVARYRLRLLGVYDGSTGDPLAGASVTDTVSRTTARTTGTGTVSLAFLPDGISTLRIQKPGYTPVLVDVRISPADTVPLTLILAPTKPH
jgi:hypothetical protein